MPAAPPKLAKRRLWPVLWADPSVRVGLLLVFLLALTAVLADVLAPADPSALGPVADQLLPPHQAHPLGTDPLGRDVLGRLIHGSRVSLAVSWVAVAVAICCGLLVGLVKLVGSLVTKNAFLYHGEALGPIKPIQAIEPTKPIEPIQKQRFSPYRQKIHNNTVG